MSSTHYNRVDVLDLLNHDNYPITAHSIQRQAKLVSHSNHYVCNLGECTRRFSSEKALIAHFEKAHGSSTQYICPHCRSSFSTSPNLNKHIRSVHEKLKPYKCDKCIASFSFRDGLQRHSRMVHDQIRPFQCPYCSLKFKTKAHLGKHTLSIHSIPLSASCFRAPPPPTYQSRTPEFLN